MAKGRKNKQVFKAWYPVGLVLQNFRLLSCILKSLAKRDVDNVRLVCSPMARAATKYIEKEYYWNTKTNKLFSIESPSFRKAIVSVSDYVSFYRYHEIMLAFHSAYSITTIPKTVDSIVAEISNHYSTRNNNRLSVIPDWITHLNLALFSGEIRNDRLKVANLEEALPSGLQVLVLGTFFDQSVDTLPQRLRRLEIGDLFDHPVDFLPPTLSVLAIGNQFNQPIDHLPSSLTILKLGKHFTYRIDHLPCTLKELTFSDSSRFNCGIGHLPRCLHKLKLGNSFSRDALFLPDSIFDLEFGLHYSSDFNFPKSLGRISIPSHHWKQIVIPQHVHITVKKRTKEIILTYSQSPFCVCGCFWKLRPVWK